MKEEPLEGGKAKREILEILEGGTYFFSKHAEKELAKDNLTSLDAINVLRGGRITEPAEFENGSWRYRVHTQRMTVVISFGGAKELVVVTAWRWKRK